MPLQDVSVVGHYLYRYGDDSWWWSDGMRAAYGGELSEDAELDQMMRHVHEDERTGLLEAMARCTRDGTPFGLTHRAVDVNGNDRSLMLTGDRGRNSAGREIRGMALDLEPAVDAAVRYAASLELSTALASHAVIDQAKGVFMLLYGVDEDGAFDLLRWSSMRVNVKLLTIAHRILVLARNLPGMAARDRDHFASLIGSPPDALPAPRRTSGRARVSISVLDGYVPAVAVRGRADLRAAKEVSDAAREVWPHAAASRALRIDLEHATRIGPTMVEILGALGRHAARDGVAVSVQQPADRAGEPRRAPGTTEADGISTRSAGAREQLRHRRPR
ncbi:ANTAR domain-containing protein [Cellulomonas edaphi]|uniref:ANTAR domain-containing protein n=1 Tax=Cellulomonas edaphi TaxID=3053468 RepID=A0ABT7S7R7_9CELL|nr:ANTAR domain-containing protein [Cellulomons edaphi]MDM7831636.1 ANTAR domain-containing protein [Cellulomons edaphi]